MPTEQSVSRSYAGFFVRMFAFFLDCTLFLLISGTIRFPYWLYTLFDGKTALTSPLLFSFSAWDIIIYLASAAYFIILTYCSGTTVGKRLMGLRVVSADGSRLTLWNVLYRETLGRYLSSILWLGYLMIGISSEKKALHDLLCDTRVIYWTRPDPQYEKPVAPTKREEKFTPYVPPFGTPPEPQDAAVPPFSPYGVPPKQASTYYGASTPQSYGAPVTGATPVTYGTPTPPPDPTMPSVPPAPQENPPTE